MGYFDESISATSAPLTIESVTQMVTKIYKQSILPTIAVMHPRRYHDLDYLDEVLRQGPQWNKIGAGILPWIPRSQRRLRKLRGRVRLALGEFLLRHGFIEVDYDDWR